MSELRVSGWLVIFFSLVIGLILMLLPLPNWAQAFRPAWLLLIILYWSITLPHRVGLIIAWLCGLILDVMQGTLLGENALGFLIITYIAIKMHRQIRMFSSPGQSATIFLLLLLNQFLLFWLQGLQGQMVTINWFWGVPLISACLWPWISVVLDNVVRGYRLN